MSLAKSYLRYEPYKSFGLITTFPCPVLFDRKGSGCFSGASEAVNVWNVRTGVLVSVLKLEDVTSPVTVIAVHPDRDQIAVGYSDGWIRIWDVKQKTVLLKYKAHRSAVNCLSFNKGGSYLASGGNDNDIVIWDVIAEQGLAKLSSHTNAITSVRFLEKTRGLVSSSKDTFIKVWDLDTQFCVQTVVGSPSEIWDIDVNEEETRIITICSDTEIRVYKILNMEEIKPVVPEDNDQLLTEQFKRIEYFGSIERKGSGRGTQIKFTYDGSLIGVLSSNRQLEILYVHTEEEVDKKKKKRVRRERKKWNEKLESGEVEGEYEYSGDNPTDEYSHKQIVKLKSKIMSFDFEHGKRGKEILFATNDNKIELYKRKKQSVDKLASIFLPGHRHPIRYTSISSNNQMLLTTSTDEIKIWNMSTTNCIRTMASGYGLCGFFVPGDRHALIGTKEGAIELYDLNGAECIAKNEEIHKDAIYSVELKPDKTGFLSASTDKVLTIWDFELKIDENGAKKLDIVPTQTIDMPDGIFCAKFSPNGKYIAVSLADNTVRIYFADTLKFYLSLYGHKLPVTTLDFPDDSTIIATASADKNIRIWGLDFGDCHRSIFAHDDTITKIEFARGTHYLFSCSKDGTLKYWDMDKYERIMTLNGHNGAIWGMALTQDAEFAITVGQDRRVRIWERTKEILIVDVERETEMENELDSLIEAEGARSDMMQEDGAISIVTSESVKVGETLVEAIELAEEEKAKFDVFEKRVTELKLSMNPQAFQKLEESNSSLLQPPEKHQMMPGTPEDYVYGKINAIPGSILESVLASLAFDQVLVLLAYIDTWIKSNKDIEKICRILFFLLRMNQVHISSHKACLMVLDSLREHTRKSINEFKNLIGFNMAAMNFMRREIEARGDTQLFEISEKLHKLKLESASSRTSKRNYWEESSEEEDFEP
eukprot:TRINITY_DN3224_c0_g1_i1.p1 TRINITY_DN3224_c0_g1~~TRINITY_DN3224_c0_g1_i1.p1  ORF type:complete len:934 (+),score=229.71 TRINITY_DN3224_c0_g1_i1:18-2819(+)